MTEDLGVGEAAVQTATEIPSPAPQTRVDRSAQLQASMKIVRPVGVVSATNRLRPVLRPGDARQVENSDHFLEVVLQSGAILPADHIPYDVVARKLAIASSPVLAALVLPNLFPGVGQ